MSALALINTPCGKSIWSNTWESHTPQCVICRTTTETSDEVAQKIINAPCGLSIAPPASPSFYCDEPIDMAMEENDSKKLAASISAVLGDQPGYIWLAICSRVVEHMRLALWQETPNSIQKLDTLMSALSTLEANSRPFETLLSEIKKMIDSELQKGTNVTKLQQSLKHLESQWFEKKTWQAKLIAETMLMSKSTEAIAKDIEMALLHHVPDPLRTLDTRMTTLDALSTQETTRKREEIIHAVGRKVHSALILQDIHEPLKIPLQESLEHLEAKGFGEETWQARLIGKIKQHNKITAYEIIYMTGMKRGQYGRAASPAATISQRPTTTRKDVPRAFPQRPRTNSVALHSIARQATRITHGDLGNLADLVASVSGTSKAATILTVSETDDTNNIKTALNTHDNEDSQEEFGWKNDKSS